MNVSTEVPPGRLKFSALRLGALTIFACCAFLIALLLDAGRGPLAAAAAGTLSIFTLMFLAARRLTPALATPTIGMVSFVLQALWLLLNSAVGTVVAPNGLDVSASPLRATLPLILVPLGGLIATAALARNRRTRGRSILRSAERQSRGVGPFLLIAALVSLLMWPATISQSPWAYAVRVLNSALLLVPLFAGAYTVHSKWLSRIWITVMSVNAVIGLLTGSRFIALFPPTLFLVGRMLFDSKVRRRRYFWTLAILALPGFMVSGIVGSIRTEVGRGADLLDASRPTLVMGAVAKRVDQVMDGYEDSGLEVDGFGRMVHWTNQAVSIMSPEEVPYRGFTAFESELMASARINALTGHTTDDALDSGLASAPANKYGFMVNAFTSVEFGVFADAWSRGGPLVCLAFGFVAFLLLGLAEISLLATRSAAPGLSIITFAVVTRTALDLSAVPLLHAIRTMLLNVVFVVGLALLGEAAIRVTRGLTSRAKARGVFSKKAREEA